MRRSTDDAYVETVGVFERMLFERPFEEENLQEEHQANSSSKDTAKLDLIEVISERLPGMELRKDAAIRKPVHGRQHFGMVQDSEMLPQIATFAIKLKQIKPQTASTTTFSNNISIDQIVDTLDSKNLFAI